MLTRPVHDVTVCGVPSVVMAPWQNGIAQGQIDLVLLMELSMSVLGPRCVKKQNSGVRVSSSSQASGQNLIATHLNLFPSATNTNPSSVKLKVSYF